MKFKPIKYILIFALLAASFTLQAQQRIKLVLKSNLTKQDSISDPWGYNESMKKRIYFGKGTYLFSAKKIKLETKDSTYLFPFDSIQTTETYVPIDKKTTYFMYRIGLNSLAFSANTGISAGFKTSRFKIGGGVDVYLTLLEKWRVPLLLTDFMTVFGEARLGFPTARPTTHYIMAQLGYNFLVHNAIKSVTVDSEGVKTTTQQGNIHAGAYWGFTKPIKNSKLHYFFEVGIKAFPYTIQNGLFNYAVNTRTNVADIYFSLNVNTGLQW